jgi:hypothetical protein
MEFQMFSKPSTEVGVVQGRLPREHKEDTYGG